MCLSTTRSASRHHHWDESTLQSVRTGGSYIQECVFLCPFVGGVSLLFLCGSYFATWRMTIYWGMSGSIIFFDHQSKLFLFFQSDKIFKGKIFGLEKNTSCWVKCQLGTINLGRKFPNNIIHILLNKCTWGNFPLTLIRSIPGFGNRSVIGVKGKSFESQLLSRVKCHDSS